MIQKHRLLLNFRFSASTETAVANASTLSLANGYQVNNIQGLGGGIVSPTNIRSFLADVNNANDFIVNDFFSYLTGNTTTVEFSEIYNSDQKLSDVFNNYYQSSIVNSISPPISTLDDSLAGTSGITVVENQYFKIDGYAPTKGLDYIPLSINDSSRKLRTYSALTTFTDAESYYIPVFIKRNAKQISGDKVYFDQIQQIIREPENTTNQITGITIGDYYDNSYSSYGSYGSYESVGTQLGGIISDVGETQVVLGDSIFDQFLTNL